MGVYRRCLGVLSCAGVEGCCEQPLWENGVIASHLKNGSHLLWKWPGPPSGQRSLGLQVVPCRRPLALCLSF